MKTYQSYQKLKKPNWAPPAWLFGPVWTFLYLLIIISFGYVAYSYIVGMLPFFVLLPFILNIIFNILFTPIQFKLKNNILAAIDVVLVLVTLVWSMVVVSHSIAWVVYINIPYLLWVTFATTLQLRITYLNRK